MNTTKYREDAEITRTLKLVKQIWLHNNFLNLGELLAGVCREKQVDLSHLTDLQLENYIMHYLQGDGCPKEYYGK